MNGFDDWDEEEKDEEEDKHGLGSSRSSHTNMPGFFAHPPRLWQSPEKTAVDGHRGGVVTIFTSTGEESDAQSLSLPC